MMNEFNYKIAILIVGFSMFAVGWMLGYFDYKFDKFRKKAAVRMED